MKPFEFSAFSIIQALVADELRDNAGKGAGVEHAHLILPQFILFNNTAEMFQFFFVDLQISYRSF